jgi:hypothetical protein
MLERFIWWIRPQNIYLKHKTNGQSDVVTIYMMIKVMLERFIWWIRPQNIYLKDKTNGQSDVGTIYILHLWALVHWQENRTDAIARALTHLAEHSCTVGRTVPLSQERIWDYKSTNTPCGALVHWQENSTIISGEQMRLQEHWDTLRSTRALAGEQMWLQEH